MIQFFAITAAWTGEKDLALQQLELGLRAPVASQVLNYGALKLLPFWDPLRGDPRFEKIVAESRQIEDPPSSGSGRTMAWQARWLPPGELIERTIQWNRDK
jgi:hypothetical protein